MMTERTGSSGRVMNALRVLIVEDVESDAALVLRELARGAYDVSHLRVETIDALRRALCEHTWDLVISDFSLPTMTAMDVLKELAASRLDLPCIVISGTIEEEGAVHALRSGARDFIVKDRPARLLPAISRELREADDRRRKCAAEAALDEAKDRMRLALESAGVGTWEADLASGNNVWSDVLERLHGLGTGEFGGTFEAFIQAIHPDDRQRVQDLIAQSIGQGTEASLEYRTIWPNGSVHWIAAVGRPFYDETGRPVRAAGVGMDVTSRKNLEDQLRQSQKIEAIGQLAGGVAHDFNNVLTAIVGFCELLLGDPALHDSQRQDVSEIRKAADRATRLTQQLLAFSRRQILQPKVLDINALIGDLKPMLRRLVFENIDLVVLPKPATGLVRIDPTQFEQILVNLSVNARDAMPHGGKLTIETADVRLDQEYRLRHLPVIPGDYILMAVSDTGVGMNAATRQHIFEPFFTTKAVNKGTGLGLATVYGIVKQSDGYVWVYSEPGRGTTFKIYLPRVTHGMASAKAAATENIDLPRGLETILVVEDDEGLRRLARRALEGSGYHVLEAGNPRVAVQTAREYGSPIHLLLSDVVMPESEGPPLIDRLSAMRPGLRVLYMSGYADEAIVHHGVLKEGVPFLQKPFTPQVLARKVRDVLDAPPPSTGM